MKPDAHTATAQTRAPISCQLLTISDLMAVLRISRASVYRLMATGALRPIKLGKSTRFRASEVEELIEKGAA